MSIKYYYYDTNSTATISNSITETASTEGYTVTHVWVKDFITGGAPEHVKQDVTIPKKHSPKRRHLVLDDRRVNC